MDFISKQTKKPNANLERKEMKCAEANSDFDLDSHIKRYSGYGKIARLVFIAQRSQSLQVRAFEMAIAELKTTLNTEQYLDTISLAREHLGDALDEHCVADEDWMRKANGQFHDRMGRLEADLSVKLKESVKEKIRDAYRAIGFLFMDKGDFSSAIAKFLEARDYASSHLDAFESSLSIIKAGVFSNSLGHIKNQVDRCLQLSGELSRQPAIESQVYASCGLYELRRGNFGSAADAFLKVKYPLPDTFSDVMAPIDVAIYGTLSALAYLERPQLKKRVLDNEVFRKFLELAPSLRQLVSNFYNCEYASCFHTIALLERDLVLDMNVAQSVPKLIKRIRDKAMVQYFSPFVAVKLPQMAAAFNLEVPTLEKELVTLIADNKIQARIDSHNKVLYAKNADQRVTTFEKAFRVGSDYVRDARSLLLRMNLVKHHFSVKAPHKRAQDADDVKAALLMSMDQ